MATPTATGSDFRVADLSLADFGRKEITLAEHEMPGLMAIRREYSEAKPLRGVDPRPVVAIDELKAALASR